MRAVPINRALCHLAFTHGTNTTMLRDWAASTPSGRLACSFSHAHPDQTKLPEFFFKCVKRPNSNLFIPKNRLIQNDS